MLRSLMFRAAAALALVPVVCGAPVSALAHGVAHHRMHHEASEAGHQPETGWLNADLDHGDDHAHLRLANAVRTDNSDARLIALLPVSEGAVDPLSETVVSSASEGPASAPSNPGTGPPPRLRAPPLA